jgi:hypothetical protein
MDEQWSPVVGFPDYEVSDQGRVRSVCRETMIRRRGGRMTPLILPERILTLQCHSGSPRVYMQRPGKVRSLIYINRSVLMAFVGDMSRATPRHINGDSMDCRLSNLEWKPMHPVVCRKAKPDASDARVRAQILRQDMKEGAIMLTRGASETNVQQEFGFTPEQMLEVLRGAAEAKRIVLQRHQARTSEGARA